MVKYIKSNHSTSKYPHIDECKDRDYLYKKLSPEALSEIERILSAYADGKIDFEIERYADDNTPKFDGNVDIIINDKSYKSGGMEELVLKWVEDYEDTGYLVDAFEDNYEPITGSTNEYGEKQYEVAIGNGTMYPYTETVWAYNEQEAVDKVVDHLDEMSSDLVADHWELFDSCGIGQTVDDYAEENNLTVAGNHGLYVELVGIREV